MEAILRRKAKLAEATGAVACAERVSRSAKPVATRALQALQKAQAEGTKRHHGEEVAVVSSAPPAFTSAPSAPEPTELRSAPPTSASLAARLRPPPSSTPPSPRKVPITACHPR